MAFQAMKVWRHGVLGLDVLPYQLSLGVTLRYFEGGVHFRLYVGPVKFWGGVYPPPSGDSNG